MPGARWREMGLESLAASERPDLPKTMLIGSRRIENHWNRRSVKGESESEFQNIPEKDQTAIKILARPAKLSVIGEAVFVRVLIAVAIMHTVHPS